MMTIIAVTLIITKTITLMIIVAKIVTRIKEQQ